MTTARRIYDCFTFSTELDVLAMRLELLEPVVDHFVLVEATRTHSGNPKPLVFDENRARFERFADKIIHVVVDDLPDPDPDRWIPERFQRDCITRGLDGSAPDDLVIVSDVDELPEPGVLTELRDVRFDVAVLELRMCYYRANWELDEPWPLTRIARADHVTSPQDLRDSKPLLAVRDAGVHLSSLMDVSQIVEKYRNFAHAELDNRRESSADFLELMQDARIFAPHLKVLRVREADDLLPIQEWLFARRPDLFEFGCPSSLERKVALTWARTRRVGAVPDDVVLRGDRVLARLAGARKHASTTSAAPVGGPRRDHR